MNKDSHNLRDSANTYSMLYQWQRVWAAIRNWSFEGTHRIGWSQGKNGLLIHPTVRSWQSRMPPTYKLSLWSLRTHVLPDIDFNMLSSQCWQAVSSRIPLILTLIWMFLVSSAATLRWMGKMFRSHSDRLFLERDPTTSSKSFFGSLQSSN